MTSGMKLDWKIFFVFPIETQVKLSMQLKINSLEAPTKTLSCPSGSNLL